MASLVYELLYDRTTCIYGLRFQSNLVVNLSVKYFIILPSSSHLILVCFYFNKKNNGDGLKGWLGLNSSLPTSSLFSLIMFEDRKCGYLMNPKLIISNIGIFQLIVKWLNLQFKFSLSINKGK